MVFDVPIYWWHRKPSKLGIPDNLSLSHHIYSFSVLPAWTLVSLLSTLADFGSRRKGVLQSAWLGKRGCGAYTSWAIGKIKIMTKPLTSRTHSPAIPACWMMGLTGARDPGAGASIRVQGLCCEGEVSLKRQKVEGGGFEEEENKKEQVSGKNGPQKEGVEVGWAHSLASINSID